MELSGMTLFSVIKAPAPIRQFLPILAPLSTVAPHANQGIVANGAAMDDGAVADRAIFADDERVIGIGVEDAVLLHIGAGADADGFDIAARHHAEPDADLGSDPDVADQHGSGGDPADIGVNVGGDAIEGVKGHGSLLRA
jgi:hypothetical protein